MAWAASVAKSGSTAVCKILKPRTPSERIPARAQGGFKGTVTEDLGWREYSNS